MMIVLLMSLMLWIAPVDTAFQQGEPCPGITIVENGVQAFTFGEPRIGPYTDVFSYVLGGIEYIDRTCGVRLTADYFLP